MMDGVKGLGDELGLIADVSGSSTPETTTPTSDPYAYEAETRVCIYGSDVRLLRCDAQSDTIARSCTCSKRTLWDV